MNITPDYVKYVKSALVIGQIRPPRWNHENYYEFAIVICLVEFSSESHIYATPRLPSPNDMFWVGLELQYMGR